MYFERFQKESAQVPGFVTPESIAIWDFLLAEQQREQITGGLLEIGVYYGKSAIMLAIHARPEEELVLVDFSDFADQAAVNIHKFKNERVRMIKAESSSSACWALTKDQKHSFRWIHIDGDHKAKTVENDLRLAGQLLAEDGIICVDDFFNARYPQLTFAVNQFLLTESSKFKMFLCGFNKAYIARARRHREFLRSIHANLGPGLTERGFSNFTIYKTDLPGVCNSFGIGSRWQQYVYYGLDENPNRIVY
jgi:predicted O-methyltransferase YrrM